MSDSDADLVVLIPYVQMISCFTLTKSCSSEIEFPDTEPYIWKLRKPFSFQNCFEGCALRTSKVLQSAFIQQIGTLWWDVHFSTLSPTQKDRKAFTKKIYFKPWWYASYLGKKSLQSFLLHQYLFPEVKKVLNTCRFKKRAFDIQSVSVSMACPE